MKQYRKLRIQRMSLPVLQGIWTARLSPLWGICRFVFKNFLCVGVSPGGGGGGGGQPLIKIFDKYWYLSHFYMAVFLYFRGYNIEQVSVWKVLCVTSVMSSELFKSCACYKIQLAWW